MKKTYRQKRTFSEALRRDIVNQIDRGNLRVCDAYRTYQVSENTIYNWIHKYSQLYKNQCHLIVEKKSESKKTKDLQDQVKKLEQALGRKQMELDFIRKSLDIYKQQTGEDVIKKSERRL